MKSTLATHSLVALTFLSAPALAEGPKSHLVSVETSPDEQTTSPPESGAEGSLQEVEPSTASPVDAADTKTPSEGTGAQESPGTSSSPSETGSALSSATSAPASESRDTSLRFILAQYARDARVRRIGESAVGIASSGALLGVGFAAEGPNMGFSHGLWITSGVALGGSLLHLLLPSELEKLECDAPRLSDTEVRARWRELAQKARMERRFGSVFGILVGGVSVALGVLTFEDKIGELTDDQRRILGSTLVAGGALSAVESGARWFVQSPLESGYTLVEPRPQVSFSAGPLAGGFALGIRGGF